MPTTVRSHSKINLGLYIGAPRTDGFHSLATVYQTLELHDLVTVAAHPAPKTSISLTSNDPRVPTDSRNTAWKMVSLALEDLGTPAEVTIHIEKRLPIQGGLGAGSANAIAALVALETELDGLNPIGSFGAPSIGRILSDGWESTDLHNPDPPGAPGPGSPRTGHRSWGGGLDSEILETKLRIPGWLNQRLSLAAKVGSDVPLFLIGGTVLGLDRGKGGFPPP